MTSEKWEARVLMALLAMIIASLGYVGYLIYELSKLVA